MRFFAPRILWMLLPVWIALPVIWHLIEKKASTQLSRFASAPLLKLILRGGDPEAIAGRRRTRFILILLSSLLAIIALARPQLGVREEALPSEGLDIAFLFDVSNSMLTEDVVPSRLKKAKHIVRNFIDRLAGDRAGIVAFAGSAYPAVPLTTDYDFVKQTLDVMDETTIANQGTDLGAGLEVARDLLLRGGMSDDDDPAHQSSTDNQASRVIVILSDGESHEGEETRVVPSLKDKGIRVYSIGVGSAKGGPIPLRDNTGYLRGYKKDSGGNMVLTKLESANLEAIAGKTGGKYYAASSNEGEVEEILSQLSSMERTQGAGRRVIVYDEMFQYPLAGAILFLLILLWLRESPGRRARPEAGPESEAPPPTRTAPRIEATITALVGLIACGLLLGPREARATSLGEYSDTRKGVESYADKDYPTAIQHFGKAQASNPDSPVHHMNLGDALLKAGSVDGAAAEFQAASKAKGADDSARGSYNLGKAFEQGKDHEKAIRAYQAGLDRLAEDPKSDPEIEGRLKRALEIAMQNKQQQQQQQEQQQQQNGSQGQGEGKNDQQKQQEQKKQEGQKYEIGKQKPKFKDEKLNEGDAKRVMQQMQEQEKKSQQRVMRAKSGKPKDDKIGKDW